MPTILLVEDEPAILEHLRYALERSGYTVLGAISGDSAIRTCHAHQGAIDVLICDVLMSPVSGFAVASVVKSAHPTAIVILMSGSPRYVFPKSPVNEFLEKPFHHDDLLAAISRHAELPKAIGATSATRN